MGVLASPSYFWPLSFSCCRAVGKSQYTVHSLASLESLGVLSGEACTASLDVMSKPGQGERPSWHACLGPDRCSDPHGAHAALPVLLIGARGGAGAVVVLALPCHRAARGAERGREHTGVGEFLGYKWILPGSHWETLVRPPVTPTGL
ncbi:hypothetical protein PVAP13_3NG076907 [Panicum virgatum]|uniref:Uncharacterized protein n=1 Tax=Panicum virgatum TaxID=38727 RepID=A0A8T0UBW5_PANVG|nr:hypothetical protein PVAP13_3NG076907 [Panicum virgatum]